MNPTSEFPPLAYDPAHLEPTTAHIGVGAFHRAHQQSYYDDLARAGAPAGVIGVNLTPPDIAARFASQGNRYCVLTEDQDTADVRTIGTLCRIHDAHEAGSVDWDGITFVTLTVTEKGYCHHSGTSELNLDLVAGDMARPEHPETAIGFLALMLERRRRAGGAPITLASCDNVPENGRLLQRLMEQYAALVFPELLPWMQRNVRFPVSMVDRIVPAMRADDRARLEAAAGRSDAIGVVAEPFRQWVIEDSFAGPRPALERAGVQIVPDVAPYTKMKYRLLNGLQSAYAELGRICGCETSFDAATLPELAAWAEVFHASQALTLSCPEGEDLAAYSRTSLKRLQNPRIRHSLNQIATDASFKLPQRIGQPAEDLLRMNAVSRSEPQAMVLAAWALNGGGQEPDSDGIVMNDPLRETMAGALRLHGAAPEALAAAVLALPVLPEALAASADFRRAVARWIERFSATDAGGRAALIGRFSRETLNA